MYTIKEEDYKLLDLPTSPYSFEEIPNESKQIYLLMYSLYMHFFTQYLIQKTDLIKFEKYIEETDILLNEVPVEEKDVYQLLATDKLKYFYIRNNLYLHNLTSEEMWFLNKKIQSNDLAYNGSVEEFISKTYKKVIREATDIEGVLVNFGPFNNNFFAPNNSLVIGVRFEDTYKYDQVMAQGKMYVFLKEQIEQDLKNKLGHPTTLLKYDNMSVKKKINEQSIKNI